VVSLSTVETGFISTITYVAQNIWMIGIFENLGIKIKCIIFCDNSSTNKRLKNLIIHDKSKHIHVRCNLLWGVNKSRGS